jgi:hypothetical protein
MWRRHALAFLAGMVAAAVCIVAGLWVYVEVG